MRSINYKNILVTIFVLAINVSQFLAQPAKKGAVTRSSAGGPAVRGNDGFGEDGVVYGVIDDYIPFMIVIALILGLWFINRINNESVIEKVERR